MVIVSYFRKRAPPKRGENRGKDASCLSDFLQQRRHVSAEYIYACVWGCGWGDGEKPLNMLLPWGQTAVCDLEKQRRVMGILNK